METFTLGIVFFTMIVITLVTVIMFAKSKLVSTGDVNITINGEKTVFGHPEFSSLNFWFLK